GEGTGKEEGLLTDRIIRTSDLQDGVLYLPNDPYDTRVGPMSMKLLIGPRTSIELVLNVSAPHYNGTMMVEDTTVTLLGELPDMEAFRTIEFKMDVIYPDISFSSGVQVFNMEKDLIEGSTEPGDHVCMFSIENLGLTPSGPFMVILWINGNADASLEVNSLSPGEDRELSIKVYFPEGELEIEIEIDPYNNIYEYKDQFMKQGQNDNNKRALSILVEKESEYSIAFYVMISLWMLLAVLIIAFILIVVASIRKKKDVHEE
ncbi:MAG: CARDB domain-containing protein, partial [Candidatus Thermoplasmatota archaeon]|nr:CARDB domain-containing protein [Candidatus Thermoplasmatota archaeon]